jgi:hypothetical protein
VTTPITAQQLGCHTALDSTPGRREAVLGQGSACRSMRLSTSFKCSPMRVPCGAAVPRLRERGTARVRREALGPPCASSAPAAGRSPRTWRGRTHPLLDRVRLFARQRKNVAQEGFDALVHWVCPLYRPSASRIAVRLRRLRAGPEKAVLVEPGGRGCEFTFLVHPTCRGTPDDRNKQMVAKFNGWREPQAALVR